MKRSSLRLTVTVLCLLLSLCASAAEIRFTSQQIECSSCAKKIKRVLEKDARVKKAMVDVNHKQVRVALKAGKSMTDAELREVIAPTQYEIDQIQRND